MDERNLLMQRILGKVEIDTIMKRMAGKKLKQTERNYLSRSVRPKLMAAKLLTHENILEKIQMPDKSLGNKILYNLSKYGYDLISLKNIKKQKIMPIEELISTIILKSPKPRFIEAIPILLLKNKIDKFKLAEIAYKNGIYNQLGYLIETASMLAKKLKISRDFSDIQGYMEDRKEKEIKYLGEEKDTEYMQFLSITSPKRIKRWNLLGRFFDEDFIKNAEAYV